MLRSLRLLHFRSSSANRLGLHKRANQTYEKSTDAIQQDLKGQFKNAVQELDCLAISELIRTKTLFNAYTMISKIEGCLLQRGSVT